MSLNYRKAEIEDVLRLQRLIEDSARALSIGDYTPEQIEAALGTVWGVDEELIHDQTFYLVEDDDGRLAGCGGWSKRKKLFGASSQNEHSPLLDPESEAARIRAFFVLPDYARRGIGREIIRLCEAEAVAAGFRKMELMATLPGHRLYRSCGYSGDLTESVPCGNTGYAHTCIAMHKYLETADEY